ncbi:MAG TPA: hypothetical protein VGR47_03790 [Terracidiphilus sp.]|nr:hypothetical protein [Terracidiphilus sp.]
MANLCIRVPYQVSKNARIWAAINRTTVTEAVRLFLDGLHFDFKDKPGAASARPAAARSATPPAAARAIVTARPTVTLRFSDENPAPAPAIDRRHAP